MSTSEQSVGIQAEHPAERALFRALFDDAAVFPPGLAPLPQAVADHAARQASSYADLVGPLLLPASLIENFIHCERPRQIDVALIGRPGTDLARVDAARSRFDADPGLAPDGNHGAYLMGIEIGWSPDACVDHDLAFKLTGGLHHAISQTTPDGEDRFGFLNVLAATHWALAHGAKVHELKSLLSQRDPKPILGIIKETTV